MGLLELQRVYNVYNPNADPPEPKVIGGQIFLDFDGPVNPADYDSLIHTLVVRAVVVRWANADRPIVMELEAEDDNGKLEVSVKGAEKGLDEEIEVELEGTVTILRLLDDETRMPYYEVPNLKTPA